MKINEIATEESGLEANYKTGSAYLVGKGRLPQTPADFINKIIQTCTDHESTEENCVYYQVGLDLATGAARFIRKLYTITEAATPGLSYVGMEADSQYTWTVQGFPSQSQEHAAITALNMREELIKAMQMPFIDPLKDM